MPETPPQTESRERPRRGLCAVAYWLIAGLVYLVLGVAYPPAFLLGFQESVLFVFVVTALAPHVLRRPSAPVRKLGDVSGE